MTEYKQQALDFLKACNATMEITLIGTDINRNWSDNLKRNKYNVTLKTPNGSMNFDFWDSAYNTEICNMTLETYIKKKHKMLLNALTISEANKANKELLERKKAAKPTEYDILACLQQYEVGTMHDFFHEFGYEVHNVDDMFRFMNLYNAVVKEYQDLCRIFTSEQMEKIREIW